MKGRRLKGLFLVSIMSIILAGCGKKTISLPTTNSPTTELPSTDIARVAMEQCGFVSINESKTMYYSPEDYRVLVLDDYYIRFGQNYITINNLIIDGKEVYYDIKNECYTMQPPLAN